ncbi:Lrp/AsnC family transcriptional regulator [Gluconacetobacter entanii]|uniref:Lrp/AsnC family transcriptional regulator n=1 Tax=Gluconacetobacter entanii TaxID=108528 RepID=UPI001C9320B6|nr:Lrp/AsnC family transcriptional regulator [Gluconacetobacter entanii]MBY4639769.1 Lrp/AsnC family transcriptional regulator [Gluconacetobacter entanii]MCW4579485.1 Lrp/AsnC family transcriptional regulator [Gluconacetobacter entanii]MCW4582862.1 Lrp/AsnC family transcriptional regulator [Gluconacetobacter entanii]MCW4586287.1 Lrp/AsnC family transcriptional regulator [Gluconacetobacter entanii]
MDTLNIDKLQKLWALAERGSGGEADNARRMAAAMVEAQGYVLDDIPGLLADAGLGDGAPQPGAGGFTFYNMDNPAHVRAWQREHDAKRRRWMRDNADRIAEVIARYGSEEAVFAPTAEEKALDAAIEPFREAHPDDQADTFDGSHFSPSERVVAAMGQSIPWPDTIPAALAEYEAWDRLCDDRNVADGNNQYEYLAAGASMRQSHLSDLIQKIIPARDLSDAIVRLRFQVAGEGSRDHPEAVLADLERLQAAGLEQPPASNADSASNGPEGVQVPNEQTAPPPPPTASERSRRVREFLSTMDGWDTPDRHIAKRFSVSPSTVGNIRRKMRPRAHDGMRP